MTEHFDVVIIGSGSGNSIVDQRFDDKKVALIEENSTFGGTCLNVGCIPTKMYVYAAEVARTVRDSAKYGIDAHVDAVRWPDIVERVFGRIDPISEGGKRYRAEGSPNVTLFQGHASFVGPRTIDTGTGTTITADRIVIAAGSRPIVPQSIEDSGVDYHTNNDVMRLPALPEHLVILGSGYIAAEFAHVFSALGSKVSIVARKDSLLRALDADIAKRFTELARAKWDVHLDSGDTRGISEGGLHGVELSDGTKVLGDAFLVAVGRQPNGDRLNLGAAGIELDDEGRIVVDEFGRTTAEGVFALGDVSSPYQLKHVANQEARVVQYNLLQDAWHGDTSALRTYDHRFVPAAVFTDPQIAEVGMTEEQARDAGLDITVKVQNYGDVAFGWAMEDSEGLCKIIAEKGTGKILGAHIIGAQAPTLIQPLIQAMSFGLSAQDMARGQYWIHPGLPEVVENALLGLDL
ncbi:mycothione reductase [Rhodococcus sp. 05-2255-1e]|jgi:mycothione reductase|uniref:Mycothione reductase n=1 Tax=Rhodococcoides fascians TaxID=1828 RepID=A0A143QRA3_RHOFA|nr:MULTISPECIES: mycothione reductase [Rhodococcus]AMY24917.1 Mycothione reductase [Rhodococcus fascians]AMY55942.1 Mycothione reductase [Rhodococcus fascians D188]KMJ49850.1 mycothione reductase [Rhodococcus fascians]MBY4227413.1 mycothione reductase [Rhodococcus fascians]NIL86434.1 Mycothione reductase [Rhodococcus fascians]